jgi:glycosyltransferase involved in cell wall biosynthesis
VILDQLIAAAAPADAVTNQALAWRRILAAHGIGGRIFAEHVHPQLAREVEALSRFSSRGPGAVLLRYSIWSAVVDAARRVPRDRLGLLYHNITPGHLLASEQPALAALCDRGRRELPDFAARTAVAIADSRFNADELAQCGFTGVTVVPLLLDVPETPPPRSRPTGARLLSVGRIAPSKRIEEAIRVLALLRALVPHAQLDIVGAADGFEAYGERLVRFARRLGVADAVRFRGRVSDEERDRAYADADVYVCTSAHEGFCAPLVEAMSRGLPVVAYDAGAVAETLGGGGLVVADADPVLMAEATHAILDRAELRAALVRGAAGRLAELTPAAVERRILNAIRGLAS